MKHAEAQLQIEVVKLLRAMGFVVFHLANERNAGISDAVRMRAMGVVKGAPDLLAWDRNGRSYWFELKTKTGKRSAEQECMEDLAKELGITYKLIRDIKDLNDAGIFV